MKTSYGFAQVELRRHGVTRIVQASNVAVRTAIRDQTVQHWASDGSPMNPWASGWPWRLPAQWDGGATGPQLRAVTLASTPSFNPGGGSASCYPPGLTGAGEGSRLQVLTQDTRRFRQSTAAGSRTGSTDVPCVFGALLCNGDKMSSISGTYAKADCMVASDLPYASVGPAYVHPAYTSNVTTTTGQSYVVLAANVIPYAARHSGGILRLEAGADRGVYVVRYVDRTNSRVYLANLDGTIWTATASATVAGAYGVRLAHMNEVSVIPNGVGAVAFDGAFDPGENRTSYLLRLRFEKSGSPSPADGSQKGSYWLATRPWTHGAGDTSATATNAFRRDFGALHMSGQVFDAYGFSFHAPAGYVGGVFGMALDRANQRLWHVVNDGANGAIGWWIYKSPEAFHVCASTSGSVTDTLAGVNIGTSLPWTLDIGSDNTVYVALNGGTKPGWLAIRSDLTATQVLTSDVGLGAASVRAAVVDKSRYRTGGANTVTTDVGTANLTASDGAFTAADVGRAIKVTGGADAGTYKIATRVSDTQVTVQTMAGGAVTFAGQAASGTWQIGDRIYFTFSDTTTSPGKITYMESLAWGVLLTTTITMTNGANCIYPCVDQSTGVLYTASSDTTYQVNRYDPAQAAPAGWSRRLLSDFNGANGGSGTISNPNDIRCLGVNPHASFREVWLGHDNGWTKLNPDNFAGAFSRYYGSGSDATPFKDAGGFARPDGSWATTGANTRGTKAASGNVGSVMFGPDGRVFGVMQSGSAQEVVNYVRDSDTWTTMQYEGEGSTLLWHATYATGFYLTPYGEMVQLAPWNKASSNAFLALWSVDTHYQWSGSAWFAKEVVRGALPGTLSPGLAAKDLHTTLDDLVMGVKVKFTPQGGATPPNNEFLGRVGQTGPAKADGATNGTGTFAGSGFVSTNVGDYLWLQSGADQGVYQITAYTNANTVTVKKLAGGTPAATAGGLTYSVWTMGTSTQPGPESATCIVGWGVAHDNTQDVTNILFDFFQAKTLISEQQEPVKFAVPPLGPARGLGLATYFSNWNYFPASNYTPNLASTRGLSGGPLAGGAQLLDGACAKNLGGTNGTASFAYLSSGAWCGRSAAAQGVAGASLEVDFGADVEVGTVIARVNGKIGYRGATNQPSTIADIYAVSNGGNPSATASTRTNGTGASITGNLIPSTSQSVASRTVTLSAGDFLGSVIVSGASGQTTSGQSRMSGAAATFAAASVGDVLKVTAGADTGSYRITAVAADGSYVDIRNLDQTAKTWVASSASVAWEVRNGVRECDVLAFPNPTPTTWLYVERLLSPTTAEVRVTPNATLTNSTWLAYAPTWRLVKKISYAIEAAPPDVDNNGTFTGHGASDASTGEGGTVFYADLTDLTQAQRTGRYWRLALMGRADAGNPGGDTLTGNTSQVYRSLEFYTPAGKLITTTRYCRVDTVDSQAAFLAMHVTRFDWLQASNAAASHVAGTNGALVVGGTLGDTLTLSGGNVFLGYEVRRGTGGNAAGGNSTWTAGVSDPPFVASDVGRVLRIAAGPNAGFYKITTVGGSTTVTVTTATGLAVTFAADAGPTVYAVHEGVNAGDVVAAGGKESGILTVSDDMKTLTVGDHFYLAGNATWEARRRLFAGNGTSGLMYAATGYPQLPGDVAQDHRGHLAFLAADCQNEAARTDGATTVSTATFTGSKFTPDDVGRILFITSGADAGRYEIATYVSATQVTVKEHDTGAAVTFTASAGTLSYKVYGERRFRIARYATVLRS